MKIFIALSLLITTTAFAQRPGPYSPVRPRVQNWGHTVEVQAWNHNRISVMCSGRVSMEMRSGERASTYVSMFVPANGFRSHRINIMNPNDRVEWVSHSVWCR